MAQINYLSPDERVNQQVTVNKSTGVTEVIQYINLIGGNDLEDVNHMSLKTYSEEVAAEKATYNALMVQYGFKPQNKGFITIFMFETIGENADSDHVITFPKDRRVWILSGPPHTVVSLLNPTGGAASTAKGEAF